MDRTNTINTKALKVNLLVYQEKLKGRKSLEAIAKEIMVTIKI